MTKVIKKYTPNKAATRPVGPPRTYWMNKKIRYANIIIPIINFLIDFFLIELCFLFKSILLDQLHFYKSFCYEYLE